MAKIVSIKPVGLGKADDNEAFFLPAPQWVDQISLSAGVSATYTIPTGAKWIVISSPNIAYYVKVDAAAVIPAAGITNGTGSFLAPTQLEVSGITSLGFICAAATYITISVYK